MVIDVVAAAMTTPAPRGVEARASTLPSQRSSLVPSAMEVTFALAADGPAQFGFKRGFFRGRSRVTPSNRITRAGVCTRAKRECGDLAHGCHSSASRA